MTQLSLEIAFYLSLLYYRVEKVLLEVEGSRGEWLGNAMLTCNKSCLDNIQNISN